MLEPLIFLSCRISVTSTHPFYLQKLSLHFTQPFHHQKVLILSNLGKRIKKHMEIFKKLSLVVILFCLITFSFGIIHTAADASHHNNVKGKQTDPSPTQMLEEAYSMLVTSSFRSWDMVKSYINQLQLKFFPPNVDFRSRDDGKVNGGAGERIKEATQKSFEKSKETLEESAKSAAEVMEEKVHKTAEKVKHTVSGGHDEL